MHVDVVRVVPSFDGKLSLNLQKDFYLPCARAGVLHAGNIKWPRACHMAAREMNTRRAFYLVESYLKGGENC